MIKLIMLLFLPKSLINGNPLEHRDEAFCCHCLHC